MQNVSERSLKSHMLNVKKQVGNKTLLENLASFVLYLAHGMFLLDMAVT